MGGVDGVDGTDRADGEAGADGTDGVDGTEGVDAKEGAGGMEGADGRTDGRTRDGRRTARQCCMYRSVDSAPILFSDASSAATTLLASSRHGRGGNLVATWTPGLCR